MEKFHKVLNSFNLDNNKHLILSVSGGVDSMVLLDLFRLNNNKVIIVHFNHNTRDNNIKEENLVTKYAKDHNIKLHTFSINVSEGNFQEEARNLRYKHLKEVADKYSTPYIVTAHHLDDLAETIILKTIRGSNLYGYAGIHSIYEENNYIYLKPLIELSKLEIKSYALKNNVLYLDDESNYKDNYSRNRIRNTIIPILKQESPKFLEKMLEFHYNLKDSFNYIRNKSISLLENNIISIEIFNKQDIVIKQDLIALMLERKNISFNRNLIDDLINVINSNKPNIHYNLGNSHTFVKSYNSCFIDIINDDIGFTVTLNDDVTLLPNVKKITLLSNGVNKTKNSIKICYNNLELPLVARTRKNGDLVMFNYGSKKVKDLFIDLKIPRKTRDKLIIITDSNDQILYIENTYINETLGHNNCLEFIIENTEGE